MINSCFKKGYNQIATYLCSQWFCLGNNNDEGETIMKFGSVTFTNVNASLTNTTIKVNFTQTSATLVVNGNVNAQQKTLLIPADIKPQSEFSQALIFFNGVKLPEEFVTHSASSINFDLSKLTTATTIIPDYWIEIVYVAKQSGA